MKKVEVITKAFLVEKILNALKDCDWITGVTECPVRGCGRQRGSTEYKPKSAFRTLPHVKLEFVIPDDKLEDMINLLLDNLPRETGSGKIFVYHCEEAVRISTRERGEKAIKP